MEASIYIETHDIATLKKHDVPLIRLHLQTQPKGIEGFQRIKDTLQNAECKMYLALDKCSSGEVIYGEWL